MEMTKEELQQLLEENNKKLADDFNKALSGTAARIQKETDTRFESLNQNSDSDSDKDKDTQSESLAYQTLKTELDTLKKEREAEKINALRVRKEKVLLEDINSRGNSVKSPKTVTKLLLTEYGNDIEFDGDTAYVKRGDKVTLLNDVVSEYLKSDEGLIFVPPASKVNGNNSSASNYEIKSKEKKDLSKLMEDAFKTAK